MSDPARAAALLERLIADPGFREEFRRDPVAACERTGLPELGAEVARRGKALHTLDLRESRSSLAGALAAMAAEAIGVIDLVAEARREPESETGRAMSIVMTRLDLRAVEAPSAPDDLRGLVAADDPAGREPASRDSAPVEPRAPSAPDDPPRREPPSRASSAADALRAPADASSSAPSASTAALLENPRFEAWDAAEQDLSDGEIDPRVVAILNRLVEDHDIGVSVFSTGHSQFVAGTNSVSNHFVGRAVDIASVDGQAVSPGNAAARVVAEALGRLEPELRPSEIGSPFDLGPAPFFTDAAHLDHIHVGYDDDPAPGLARRLAAEPEAEADAAPAGEEPQAPAGSAIFAAVEQKPAQADTLSRLAAIADGEPAGEAEPDGGGERSLAGAPVEYPGDDASREQIAGWMAGRAREAGLPGELPVMAALVESGLQNVDHGDRDSLGFFQMRTSFWNRGEYAGYPDDPELQMQWFIDQAVAIKELRIGQGIEDFGEDPAGWGTWIADVERPAAEFRDRYGQRLEEARALVEAADGAGGSDPLPPSRGGAGGSDPLPPSRGAGERVLAGGRQAGADAADAVQRAMGFRGTPYHWGGEDPSTGFDCSGLNQYVYSQEGIELPRVAADQAQFGRPVGRDDLLPGDLVFFADASGYVHHTGISLGGDRFVHAPHTGDVVKVSSLDEPYYAEQFSGGRRVDGSAPADPPAAARRLAAAGRPGQAASASAVFAAVKAARSASGDTFARLAAIAGDGGSDPLSPAAGGGGPDPLSPAGPAGSGALSRGGGGGGPDPPSPAAGDGGSDPLSPGDEVLPADGVDGATTEYPGDDASREAIAAWMAAGARAAGLPGELPVMAGLVESGLRNLDHGDRDSLGFFQMRASIWDRGEYAGYAGNPDLQLQWFIDQALAVKAQRPDGFGSDPASWGTWVADVERPAAEYRGRYAEQLEAAQALVAATGARA